jgi:hypothetical protein
MSECVVRMEMPNGCHDCKLRNMIGNCPIPMFDGQDEKKMWTLEECFQRPPWCPILCQLPEGHGRLADKDEMLKKIENYHRYMTVGRESDPRCIIEDSPTIVPAEAERSEP